MSKNYNFSKSTLLSCLAVSLAAIPTAQTTFNFTGGMQTYTVPAGVSSIQIEAYGAQGGNAIGTTGGLGASMQGEFAVTPGQVFDILVGEMPTTSNSGGGGTFVVEQGTNTPYIIAGGGGGGAGECCGGEADGMPGVSAADGTTGSFVSCTAGIGGIGGNGGAGGDPFTYGSGGGGGFSTDGGAGESASNAGLSYLSGGAGGAAYYAGEFGGYGGGGGAWSCCGTAYTNGSGGGGGGYSGGGGNCGSSQWGNGGGGGSYNIGTAQVNSDGTNSGNGSVVITELCLGLTTSVSATTVCDGETVTLSASSTVGGTVTWDGGVTDGVAFAPPVGTTTYTATSDDPGDCAFSVDITVNPLPTVDAGTTVNACEGDLVTLTGTGTADTYAWDGGVTDGAPFTPPAGTTTYTVTGTITATGCEDTDVVDVNYTMVDEGVTALAGTLTSDQAGATYQWMNCATTSDIAGETNQAYTPSVDGDYAVRVTVSGCTDTSACVNISGAGISASGSDVLRVFPNPTDNALNVVLSGNFTWQLSSLSGQVLLSGSAVDKTTLSMDEFTTGAYFLRLVQDSETRTIKVLKK